MKSSDWIQLLLLLFLVFLLFFQFLFPFFYSFYSEFLLPMSKTPARIRLLVTDEQSTIYPQPEPTCPCATSNECYGEDLGFINVLHLSVWIDGTSAQTLANRYHRWMTLMSAAYYLPTTCRLPADYLPTTCRLLTAICCPCLFCPIRWGNSLSPKNLLFYWVLLPLQQLLALHFCIPSLLNVLSLWGEDEPTHAWLADECQTADWSVLYW